MAKSNLLSAAFCRNTTDPGLHADGNGLFLKVRATGGKSWILRFRWQGKRPEIGLGSFKEVGLADARERAADCRKLIRAGTDPRQERGSKSSGVATFKTCAADFIKAKQSEWGSAVHAIQWSATLETYAYPVIGDKPVDQITIDDLLAILNPIWETKTETASRVRGRIEKVLSRAIVLKHRQPPNPAVWRGNLDMLLARPSKIKKVKHHPALPYADLPEFVKDLKYKDSASAKALLFTILTTARTGEVRAAQWSEIALKGRIWTIPKERMKADREHRVPLTKPVLDLLKALPRMDDGKYLFPGREAGSHMSNMSMLQFLKRDLGYPDLTVHGFRSCFRDWAAEETEYPNELCEMQLAHTIKNQAEAAYRRGDLLKRRRELLEAWTRYCGA